MSILLKRTFKPKGERITVEKIPQYPHSAGKTAKQLMRKHIQDVNDVITDEDFRNLDISIGLSNDSTPQPLEIPVGPERPKDEDKDPKIIIPWDLIS